MESFVSNLALHRGTTACLSPLTHSPPLVCHGSLLKTLRKSSAGALDGVDQWNSIVNENDNAAENETPRQELFYNLDPYILWTGDDDG